MSITTGLLECIFQGPVFKRSQAEHKSGGFQLCYIECGLHILLTAYLQTKHAQNCLVMTITNTQRS